MLKIGDICHIKISIGINQNNVVLIEFVKGYDMWLTRRVGEWRRSVLYVSPELLIKVVDEENE
ncbi:MAG: hypothetical protein ACRCVU_13730 [Flavobacterium sp.]